MSSSRADAAPSIWRRYWPLDVLAVVVFILVLIFGGILAQRASQARQLAHTLSVQSERQRQAICAILQDIPGQVPAEIRRARIVFAPAGNPDGCQPLPGLKPRPTRVFINGHPATIIVNPAQPTAQPSPRPTRTPSPQPSPSRTPSPSPSPSPSHCIAVPLHKPVCI